MEGLVSSPQNGSALCWSHFVTCIDHKFRVTALCRNKLAGLVSVEQDGMLAAVLSNHHFPTVN